MLYFIYFFSFVFTCAAHHAGAQTPVGVWATFDDETGEQKATVQIYMENEKLFGKITSVSRPSLNHRCDNMARSHLRPTHSPYSEFLPSGRVAVLTPSGVQTSNETTLLRWQWRTHVHKEKFMEKFELTSTVTNNINWTALSTVQTSNSRHLQRFAVKLYIRWLPTATRLQLFGHELASCPFCSDDETNTHLLHCRARHAHFHSQHDAFVTMLQSLHTPPDITQAIANNILYWQTHHGSNPPPVSTHPSAPTVAPSPNNKSDGD